MNRFRIPVDDGDQGVLMARFQEVARHARTQYARHLKDTGLHAGQERIIAALHENGAMRPGALAGKLGVRPPTITKTIRRLQEQGFVQRTRSGADGRHVVVSLTERGEDVRAIMERAVAKAQKQALHGLKKKERGQFGKILAKMEHNLGMPRPASEGAGTGCGDQLHGDGAETVGPGAV